VAEQRSAGVDKRELEATLELPPLERYSYLVHRVAGSEEAWALRSEEGWVLISDEGGDAFCLWPHPAFAQACIREDWDLCAPEIIPLQELFDELLPALAEDEIRLAVFPAPAGEVAIVDPRDFRHHLEEELERTRKGDS
jgi:hypothetical protein